MSAEKWGEPLISSFRDDQDAARVKQSDWSNYELIPVEEMGSYSRVFPSVLNYVLGKTGGTRMAKRSDINPVEIASFLPHIIILDIVEGQGQDADGENPQASFGCIIRLIGTSAAGHYGELTGKDVRCLANKQAVKRILTTCARVIKTGEPVGIIAHELSDKIDHLQALGLYIPLVGDNGKIGQILVAAVVSPAQDLLPH